MSTNFNPYSSPSSINPMSASEPQRRVADLGKRFLGALVDGLSGLVCLGPGYVLMILGAPSEPEGEPGGLMFAGFALVAVGGLFLLACQLYLLATRSQSVGKYLMKTQIVDFATGQPASFVNAFLLRGFVNGLIGGIPCVGAIYSIVDICFIFRDRKSVV